MAASPSTAPAAAAVSPDPALALRLTIAEPYCFEGAPSASDRLAVAPDLNKGIAEAAVPINELTTPPAADALPVEEPRVVECVG